jgi:hypothetical protein
VAIQICQLTIMIVFHFQTTGTSQERMYGMWLTQAYVWEHIVLTEINAVVTVADFFENEAKSTDFY